MDEKKCTICKKEFNPVQCLTTVLINYKVYYLCPDCTKKIGEAIEILKSANTEQ